MRNDSGSDFIGMNQHGRQVSIVPQAVLSLGSATSATSVRLLVIPPAVWACLLDTAVVALSATVVNGTIWSDSAGTITVFVTGNVSGSDASPTLRGAGLALLRTSQTLWYQVSNANTDLTINITGWLW